MECTDFPGRACDLSIRATGWEAHEVRQPIVHDQGRAEHRRMARAEAWRAWRIGSTAVTVGIG
jgi:hypothetical protein